MSDKRLIETAFPLKQTSLDSVHEKNVRHGHISTLHIWPARRPLAACRAALITSLLPDPGDLKQRQQIIERLAGRVVEKVERKTVNGRDVEKTKEETVGGILHWGRENDPELEWFREEIRKAFGGRNPKVLDPFAGGGAIPLEAMRLGCDVTAIDINPVAWFILTCTLEFPQKLFGQTHPLPPFALIDREFMEDFLKANGVKGARLRSILKRYGHSDSDGVQIDAMPVDDYISKADLAWQVRAWGKWVFTHARKDLAAYYPTYVEWARPDGEPNSLAPVHGGDKFNEPSEKLNESFERLRLVKPNAEGKTDVNRLNVCFDSKYLKDPRNPRWIAKPTVAYLWARTVVCKHCRNTLPLLKTRWLCKKDQKRVLLTIESNREMSDVTFDLQHDVPQSGGNTAQRREHDKRIGAGTMSRTGATCPFCGMIATMEDLRFEGRADRLDAVMTAVVVDGPKGKEYRLPTEHERAIAEVPEEILNTLYADIPFGLPEEQTPKAGSGAARAFSVDGYGFDTWRKLFTNRQLLSQGTFVLVLRKLMTELDNYPEEWREALIANLALVNDRLADYSSAICTWHNGGEKLAHTFSRFALPIMWDYAEVNPLSNTSGNFLGALDWVSRFVDHALESVQSVNRTSVQCISAAKVSGEYDVIITDPPYYDAIPYSDCMDFFHVWLRRQTHGLSPDIDASFQEPLGPKWNHDTGDGELIDDASRFKGDKSRSRKNYEDGMARAFHACHAVMRPDGRLVVVFANKQPEAWETLVGALIRAGFVVDGSWPIQTEMGNRHRARDSAALSSSVWIVCKKRSNTLPGWDNVVLDEMRVNISRQLREFWDAGIRGPDFVWAATGPALEAFSKYPVVKKANDPNQLMTVSEFLREVRRMVVDFVVGRVLTHDYEDSVSGLDDVTTYYLLHRHDFGMNEAPVGGCILYALSCNLSDSELTNQYDILSRSGKRGGNDETNEADANEEPEDTGGGAKVKLKTWTHRRGRNLGLGTVEDSPTPLIDQVHKLMHLWRAGNQVKVDDYLDSYGLQSNVLFGQLLQALIELAVEGSEERSVLEALSNHVAIRGNLAPASQKQLQLGGIFRN